MSNPYDLVVFDWEGTIADTLGAVFHTVAIEAEALGFGTFDFNEARNYVDLGLVKALKKAYPNLSDTQHEQLIRAVQHSMAIHASEIWLIPGTREFIQKLHDANITMAIATNKGQQSLARALQISGLDKFITVTRSAGQTAAKPCPQMLEEIIAAVASKASTTLMIGDSITDMEMAKNIHVTAIGVDFYHQQGAALKMAGAAAVFDDYQLLADYLNL
ncbi:MAG: HAD-IA family hydrolase [Legionella sp.]|uniref:HAD family hydrolase n=1 Tax=Legionella sp. TaxID=459 RepID=UPI0039E6216A